MARKQKLGAPEPIAALNRVKIRETNEPLVDIRDACPGIQVHELTCPYLRATVADMLTRAQNALPEDHCLRVGTALRTLSMQKNGWDNYYARMKQEHPQWPLCTLRRATNNFFAPYDQPAPPGHCTGGAVDVSLIGPDGEPLDTTSPLEGWEAAYTWSERLSAQAHANRMLLVHAMLDAGFSNCREEFWHYSFGDSAWAVRTGRRECCYGWVKPPMAVEARFTGAVAREIRCAARDWICAPDLGPDGAPTLHLAVLWAEQQTVSLKVEWPEERAPALMARDNLASDWGPIEAEAHGATLYLRITPQTPRLYLCDEGHVAAYPPMPEEKRR